MLNWIEVKNYKCFQESGRIKLTPGMNVVIGKNDAGKSSLLALLSLGIPQQYPHLNKDIPREQPPNPISELTYELKIEAKALKPFMLTPNWYFSIPDPPG